MMPPADRIREQNEQDPGRVAHTRQEAGHNDFLAVCPALHILQLNVEGLSAAKRSIIRDMAKRDNVDVICLQETHVDADCAGRFSISGFDLISYTLHAKHDLVLYTRNDLIDVSPQLSTSRYDVVKIRGYNIATSTNHQVIPGRTPIHPLLYHFQLYTWETSTTTIYTGDKTLPTTTVTRYENGQHAACSDIALVHDPR